MSYTEEEEKKIIDYLVEKNLMHLIKGDQVWKDLECEMVVNRTWQSMKQHFRSKMVYELHYPRYGLSKENYQLFHTHYYKKTRKPRKKSESDTQVTISSGRKLASFLNTTSSSSEDEGGRRRSPRS